MQGFATLVVSAALYGSIASSTPARAATQTGRVTVAIQRPVNLNMGDGIDFGTILATPSGGTVTLSGISDTPVANGVRLIGNSGHRGHFSFASSAIFGYMVDIPTQIILTPVSGHGAPMRVSNTVARGPVMLKIGNAGRYWVLFTPGLYTHIFMGGTLTVGPNQAPGHYTGTYNVTVNTL